MDSKEEIKLLGLKLENGEPQESLGVVKNGENHDGDDGKGVVEEEQVKKKRGRPRKYSGEGSLSVAVALSPMPISASIPLSGSVGGDFPGWKPGSRGRGIVASSFKRKQLLEFETPIPNNLQDPVWTIQKELTDTDTSLHTKYVILPTRQLQSTIVASMSSGDKRKFERKEEVTLYVYDRNDNLKSKKLTLKDNRIIRGWYGIVKARNLKEGDLLKMGFGKCMDLHMETLKATGTKSADDASSSVSERASNSGGSKFSVHVLTVNHGEDVAMRIISFSQQADKAICVLSASGVISNVTLRQPNSSGGTVTYEGCFQILSLTGSFIPSDNGLTKSRSGGMSVALAFPDGNILGGGVAGILLAANPVKVVLGSFLPGHELEKYPKTPRFEHSASFNRVTSQPIPAVVRAEGARNAPAPRRLPTSAALFHHRDDEGPQSIYADL